MTGTTASLVIDGYFVNLGRFSIHYDDNGVADILMFDTSSKNDAFAAKAKANTAIRYRFEHGTGESFGASVLHSTDIQQYPYRIALN